jgi:flagellar biosynthesis/type III secretory pathway chaperone
MGSIVLRDEDSDNIEEAETGLNELLSHLEQMCPELEKEQLDAEKIEFLVQQYSSNLMS